MDIQQEQHGEKQIEIQIADIVSAHRIMDYAISKNLFTTKELVDVAPVVARFQVFVEEVQRVQAEQEAAADGLQEDSQKDPADDERSE